MTRAAIAAPAASPGEIRLQARFWRCPFAVAAAAVLTGQLVLLAFASLGGTAFPFDKTLPLTALAAMMLAAGTWPNWNFLWVTPEGIEQQAGLTGFEVRWSHVKHVRPLDGAVELRCITGRQLGRRSVRTVRLLNRYDMDAESFGEMIEAAWLDARRG
ncbi:hypothetical protein [Parvularcula oceani]|uniref:hypothetical protein n=1 Tax=Parvularcula oceani TaxID=1247963 RepID=UPI0004E16EB4|nr:hypothetical protein [Parvularcula oceani]